MEPSPMGVPLELFCYTSTTVWVEYEAIQGAIFDHLIGMLPLFGLSLYQRSSDHGQHLRDRKSTRLNSSHSQISYAVFCLKKKKTTAHSSIKIGKSTTNYCQRC